MQPGRRLPGRVGLLAVLVLVPALVQAQADTEESAETGVAWEDQPYQVIDGKVDAGTYDGYRRYQSHCHVCHGPDGLGSSYAPGLIESLAQIGYEGYLEAVMYGIENSPRPSSR
jgi:mono/diheme cytochrome c family protein